MTRSRRAGLSRDEVRRQPLYARMLGLQYLAPSGFLCFVFLEGAVALGILLALAELVSWWGVLVLPVTVAVMVKLNDVVAGALTRAAAAGTGRAVYGGAPGGPGGVPGSAPSERALRGARTVRLAPSVIARAARGARRDERGTYGKRSAESGPGTAAESWPGASADNQPAKPTETWSAEAPGHRAAETPEHWAAETPEHWPAETPEHWPGSAPDSSRWAASSSSDGASPDSTRWTPRGDDHSSPPDLPTFPDDPEAVAPRPTRPWAGQLDDQQQRARQSASRRYQ